ncbi:MAG: hypothetical protein LBD94_02205, partial [Rickettsiales bacterium]|nr:hypothetical protein [Rickettsiales bacterium]
MKKLGILLILLAAGGARAAAPTRGTASRGTPSAPQAAVVARSAPNAQDQGSSTPSPQPTSITAPKQPEANTARAASSKSSKILFSTKAKITESQANNDVESNPCKREYWACMDQFCMSSNEDGGRCTCSNDSIKLDKEYKETIKKVEEELVKTSVIGTQIEFGDSVGIDMKSGEAIESEMECEDDEDIACKIGAAKYNAAAKLCETKV